MAETLTLNVPPDGDLPKRIDAWLAAVSGMSRSRIRALIEAGNVSVNGAVEAHPDARPCRGATVVVRVPDPAPVDALPQDIPLDVLYEDSDIIVLNKPADFVVHPAPGHEDGTLVNALLNYCDGIGGVGGEQRPGIAHRLDKDTTGAMVAAKNDAALDNLARQFMDGTIRKTYWALLHGVPEPSSARIETLIGRNPSDRKKMTVVSSNGKVAITNYKVLEEFAHKDASFVEVKIETGRTHQIRVHMKHIGCPLIGDRTYGSAKADAALGSPIARQALHSRELTLRLPSTGEPLTVTAPPPADFLSALASLRN